MITRATCAPCQILLLCVCTAHEEYIKGSSLIYMRHGPLATDATVILPTQLHTNIIYFAWLIASPKFRYPLCACSLTLNVLIPAIYLPANSGHEPNFLSENFTLCHLYFYFLLLTYLIYCLSPVLYSALQKYSHSFDCFPFFHITITNINVFCSGFLQWSNIFVKVKGNSSCFTKLFYKIRFKIDVHLCVNNVQIQLNHTHNLI